MKNTKRVVKTTKTVYAVAKTAATKNKHKKTAKFYASVKNTLARIKAVNAVKTKKVVVVNNHRKPVSKVKVVMTKAKNTPILNKSNKHQISFKKNGKPVITTNKLFANPKMLVNDTKIADRTYKRNDFKDGNDYRNIVSHAIKYAIRKNLTTTHGGMAFAGKKYNIYPFTLRRAYHNFYRFGKCYVLGNIKGYKLNRKFKKKYYCAKSNNKDFTPVFAAKMILGRLNSKKKLYHILNKNGVGINTWFGWLYEIEKKGTLLGVKVCDALPSQISIRRAISLYRHPEYVSSHKTSVNYNISETEKLTMQLYINTLIAKLAMIVAEDKK
jgi:hypothetical protein